MLCVFCFLFHTIVQGGWLTVCVTLLCELCKKPAHRGHLIQCNLFVILNHWKFQITCFVWWESSEKDGAELVWYTLYTALRRETSDTVNRWVMSIADCSGRDACGCLSGELVKPHAYFSCFLQTRCWVEGLTSTMTLWWPQPWPYGSAELYSSFRVFRNHCVHSVTWTTLSCPWFLFQKKMKPSRVFMVTESNQNVNGNSHAVFGDSNIKQHLFHISVHFNFWTPQGSVWEGGRGGVYIADHNPLAKQRLALPPVIKCTGIEVIFENKWINAKPNVRN